MEINTSQVIVTTTGSDGSATGSGTIPANFKGKLYAVRIDYSAGQAATSDVTLTHNGLTILVVSNSATDAQFFPRVNIDDEAGAAVSGLYDYFYLDGQIGVAVAQADNTETVTVYATVIKEDN